MSKPLQIERLIVGQMSTNCYLLSDPNSREILIIDPGDDADYIERIIADKGFKVTAIMSTHGHFDHCLSVYELKLAYNVPFFLHSKDRFLLSGMRKSAKKYIGVDTDPPPVVEKYLKDSDEIGLGKFKFVIMHTPGHTPGSICIYDKKSNFLITGDLIFADGGVGRTDFSYSDPKLLKKSLGIIFRLPTDTVIYPGHGDQTTLYKEKNLLANDLMLH